VTPEEISYIRAGQDVPSASPERGPRRWLKLARDRKCLGIVLGRALTDPIWWFYIAWLPKYLSDARGFSLERIALFAWMPFIAADVGNFTGGLISGYAFAAASPWFAPHLGMRLQLPADSCRAFPPPACTAPMLRWR